MFDAKLEERQIERLCIFRVPIRLLYSKFDYSAELKIIQTILEMNFEKLRAEASKMEPCGIQYDMFLLKIIRFTFQSEVACRF